MQNKCKLDLHTLSIVLMSLNGWNLMPKEKNDVFFHRLVGNSSFASHQTYERYQYEVINAIKDVFDQPATIAVMPDISIKDVF